MVVAVARQQGGEPAATLTASFFDFRSIRAPSRVASFPIAVGTQKKALLRRAPFMIEGAAIDLAARAVEAGVTYHGCRTGRFTV